MYPLDVPLWLSILSVAVVVLMAAWVFYEDASPRPLGFTGFVLAGPTSLVWFTWLPFWTVFLVVILATTLFVIGMLVGRKSPDKDNFWHYGALATGIFGKMICALLPWLFGVLSGSVAVPLWVFAVLVVIAVIAVIPKTREWVVRPFRRAHAHAEAREEEAGRPPAN